MGILMNLLQGFGHIALFGIDLICLLVLIRMIRNRFGFTWLTAVDIAGKTVVDWFTDRIDKMMNHITRKSYSPGVLLLIGMIFLMVIRCTLVAFINSFVR